MATVLPSMIEYTHSFTVRSALTLVVGAIGLIASRLLLKVGHRPKGIPPGKSFGIIHSMQISMIDHLQGPPTVPLLGNEHQIPAMDGHFQFTEWARKYGGIYSLKRFLNTTLVITDRKLIKTLLDKKSNIYSHRPASMVAHLITQTDHLLVMQYGDMWRKIRKLVHQYFMEPSCEKEHWKVQEAEAIQMVHDYLTMPEDHMLHPKRYSNSITNSLVFGIRTKTVHDEYMRLLYELMDKWSLVLEVGATPPVDSFGLLRVIPQRFLGNWRNRALEVESLMKSLYTNVLNQVKQRRLKGVQRDSFIDRVLDQQDKVQLTHNQLLFLGGVLMEGGSDTSSSLISTIVGAMTVYPEVQARAHAEIDAAIGHERSPGWSDFSKLPYINMIIKESHRWRPVSPLGVSHALAEDDKVGDMQLPKGSTVILNVWGMHHDPQTWKAPEHFHPDRFENYPALASVYAASGEWDKRDHFGYGAGRRICPGIHLAERNLIIGVAKLLWAFEFTEPSGAKNDLSAETGSSKGFLHCPKDYGCEVRLRSPLKRDTVMREYAQAQQVFGRFD